MAKLRLNSWQHAEEPQVLTEPMFKEWQKGIFRHRANVRNAICCTNVERYEAEVAELEKIAEGQRRAKKFRAKHSEERLRKDNARLVQKLCDVARESERRQVQIVTAVSPSSEKPSVSSNIKGRQQRQYAIDAENARLLKRLNNVKSEITSVEQSARSYNKHVVISGRMSRMKRPVHLVSRPPGGPPLPPRRRPPAAIDEFTPRTESVRLPAIQQGIASENSNADGRGHGNSSSSSAPAPAPSSARKVQSLPPATAELLAGARAQLADTSQVPRKSSDSAAVAPEVRASELVACTDNVDEDIVSQKASDESNSQAFDDDFEDYDPQGDSDAVESDSEHFPKHVVTSIPVASPNCAESVSAPRATIPESEVRGQTSQESHSQQCTDTRPTCQTEAIPSGSNVISASNSAMPSNVGDATDARSLRAEQSNEERCNSSSSLPSAGSGDGSPAYSSPRSAGSDDELKENPPRVAEQPECQKEFSRSHLVGSDSTKPHDPPQSSESEHDHDSYSSPKSAGSDHGVYSPPRSAGSGDGQETFSPQRSVGSENSDLQEESSPPALTGEAQDLRPMQAKAGTSSSTVPPQAANDKASPEAPIYASGVISERNECAFQDDTSPDEVETAAQLTGCSFKVKDHTASDEVQSEAILTGCSFHVEDHTAQDEVQSEAHLTGCSFNASSPTKMSVQEDIDWEAASPSSPTKMSVQESIEEAASPGKENSISDVDSPRRTSKSQEPRRSSSDVQEDVFPEASESDTELAPMVQDPVAEDVQEDSGMDVHEDSSEVELAPPTKACGISGTPGYGVESAAPALAPPAVGGGIVEASMASETFADDFEDADEDESFYEIELDKGL